MFVKGNTLNDIRIYFQERLSPYFSSSEIQLIVKVSVCKRLDISETEYMLSSGVRFSESDLLFFREVVHRLLKDEPFQHIMGETEFYGLILKTDERALIPRPETEELVAWVVEDLKEMEHSSVLDLCSGSGCIALALRSALKGSNVLAVELSHEAAELIRENAGLTGLNIDVLESDVLDARQYQYYDREVFDAVVSNPPYIPRMDAERMAANVLEFEPHMALFVEDADPLLFYRIISENCRYNLKPGAHLYFEIHEDLADGVMEVLEKNGFVNIELRKDLQGRNRMVRAQKRNFTP